MCPEKTTLPQKLFINVLVYNPRPTKAKNQFKKPKDMSGVELLDFENF